jgi:hypothetical protein
MEREEVVMNKQRIEEELRNFFNSEVKQVEKSPEWWDEIVSQVTKPIQTLSLREQISRIFSKPVWRIAIPIAVVLAVIGTLWGTGALPRLVGFESPTTPAITFAPGPSGSASYVSSFQDLGELCNSSDVIVVGTVERVIEVVPEENSKGMIYDAKSAFRINQVLKGNIGNEIVLTKIALKGPEGWVEGIAEDPPFEAGERWVLFLNADMSYNNLGPWGRYKIIDDKVYSMNRITGDNDAYGAGQLDFNGVPLSGFIAEVNKTLDSVVLTFTDSRITWAIANAVRFDVGGFQEVNVNLSTGTYGPDNVTYTIKRVDSKDGAIEMPMPAGMNITIEPSQFATNPGNEYRSTLRIRTTSDLSTGTYWIRIEYQLGKSMSGYRVLMVNINPLETVAP